MSKMTAESIDRELQELVKTDKDRAIEKLIRIIKHLPDEFSCLINEAFKYKRVPKEYMLSAILFTVSTSTGLTFYLKALGYKNYANCYFTIVGSRGDAKSEAINIATRPIKKLDDEEYDDYVNNIQLASDDDIQVKRKQVLVQNASIEAAHMVHLDNPNSIGIAIDEIFALIEKMSNPNSRDGIAWRNFLLEGYTNGHVDVSRKTTQSFRINSTCPTLLGGIQDQFVCKLFQNGNLESGFIDRLFLTPKLTHNPKLVRGEMNEQILDDYEKAIKNVLDYKRQSEKPEEVKKQFEIKLSVGSHDRIFEYTQELINRQTNAKPLVKEYMSKMQISIQKLCVIVFMMKNAFKSAFADVLREDSVELAIEINEFFFLNFCSIIEKNFKANNDTPTLKSIIEMAKKNKAQQKAVCEITGFNKGHISKQWNKL